MERWSLEQASNCILKFDELNTSDQNALMDHLNMAYPPSIYADSVKRQKAALDNLLQAKNILADAEQIYPEMLDVRDGRADDLNGYGIVFTAGGEGERLRLSLMQTGMEPEKLADFTKATYPLENFFRDFGALHANLCIVADICHQFDLDIPVIVTTGPPGSLTARVIPDILKSFNNFGLAEITTVEQESRLHLTLDQKIVYQKVSGKILPVTNPDETGGPIMKLKKQTDRNTDSCLNRMMELGCRKLILLQGTAMYDPALILNMAKAGRECDAVGVGIARHAFPDDDPYGSFVAIAKNDKRQLVILEQDIRDSVTRSLMQGEFFLPYNTGLYIFDCNLLKHSDLPDYATPPKEILPELPRSPKIGFAATDILPLAHNPAILTISPNSYGVIKTADDVKKLGRLGIALGIDKICRSVYNRLN